MIPFFIVLALVIAAAGVVVLQALKEKRDRVARLARTPRRAQAR